MGIGALEMMVLLIRDFGDEAAPNRAGNVAIACFAVAAFVGLLRPVIRQRYPTLAVPLLVVHVCGGAAGAIAAATWSLA